MDLKYGLDINEAFQECFLCKLMYTNVSFVGSSTLGFDDSQNSIFKHLIWQICLLSKVKAYSVLCCGNICCPVFILLDYCPCHFVLPFVAVTIKQCRFYLSVFFWLLEHLYHIAEVSPLRQSWSLENRQPAVHLAAGYLGYLAYIF